MEFSIFYSWQSDTEHNKKAIKIAIREAANALEKEIEELSIQIQEATSNTEGTPHIPHTILQNISTSDLFIGDLSTVGQTTNGNKKLPNPNVTIELGYAISELTWSRILIVFNKQHGTFTDLPFDIEKRSVIDFDISSTTDNNGIGRLRAQLIPRIRDIISNNPQKPPRSGSPIDSIKRAHDIKMLRKFFSMFPMKELDEYQNKTGTKFHIYEILKLEEFDKSIKSSAFHIYDDNLKLLLFKFNEEQKKITLFIYTHYSRGTTYYKFTDDNIGRNMTRTLKAIELFQHAYKQYLQIVKYVRDYYLGIKLPSRVA